MIKKILMSSWPLGIILSIWYWLIRDSWRLPFSLIDDPQFASKYLQIKSSFESGNWGQGVTQFFTVFPGMREGRFAPIFWVSYLSRFFVAGLNPYEHHLLHSLLILGILILLYFVVYEFTRSRFQAVLSAMFFCILSPGFENWFRISTQEPIQVLLLLLLILVLKNVKRVNIFVGVLSGLLLLSKETTFFMYPFFVVWYLLADKLEKEKLKQFLIVFLSEIVCFLVVLVFVMKHATWSSTNASLGYIYPSLMAYISFWKQYQLLPLVAVGGIIAVLFWKSRKIDQIKVSLLFLVLGILNFVSLLPWKYPLVRFMFTQKLGVSVFLGITFDLLIFWSLKQLKYRSVVGAIVLVCGALLLTKVSFINYLQTDSFSKNYLSWEVSDGQILNRVSQLPNNSRVYVNVSKDHFDAHEWVIMMPQYLSLFYNRSDLNIYFIDDTKVPEKDSIILDWSMYTQGKLPVGVTRLYSVSVNNDPLNVSLKTLLLSPLTHKTIRDNNTYSWSLYKVI